VIGSVFGSSSYFATGHSLAPDGDPARLLGSSGARLHNLDSARGDVERIRAALTSLRDALQAGSDGADPVPGRNVLKPVVAQVEQTADKPTFVTIDGEVVQDGTITVSLGKRPLTVGYERTPRTPLDARDALNALAATVGKLVATAGRDDTRGFADEVTALLRSGDLVTAVNRPDKGAIDTALGRIDAVLAGAEGLRSSLTARESAAAQVNLGGLLLGARPDAFAGGAAEPTGEGLYAPDTGGLAAGKRFSFPA
jgi:hypothetical protein